MTDFIPVDFEKVAHDALKLSQFGFAMKPISANQRLIPVIRKTHDGRPYPTMVPSSDAENFKNNLFNSVSMQKRRIEWETHNRYYSLWVILRAGNKQTERVDADNVHKMIQDTFVAAGVVPDDRYCRDSRQMYGDFDKAGVPDHFLFCVLIRWGNQFSLLPGG